MCHAVLDNWGLGFRIFKKSFSCMNGDCGFSDVVGLVRDFQEPSVFLCRVVIARSYVYAVRSAVSVQRCELSSRF